MGFDQLKEHLGGVAAVPVCPFRADDATIDEAGFREQIAFLRDSGVDTLVPCGNTMEFYSLTLDEVRRVNEIALGVAEKKLPVIVGIGYDTRTAIAMAQQAETNGADAVMVHQPIHPFLARAGVVDYIKAIADETSLGIVLYVRREILGIAEYRDLFELPNLVGVKHATNDLQFVAELVEATKEFDVAWICGSAEAWAPFYRLAGAHGFTSGLANVFPGFTLAMRDALAAGDFGAAMEVWRKILPFEKMRARDKNAFNVAVVKEAMNQLGRNGGVVRMPASALSGEDRRAIANMLEEWGVAIPTRP